MRTIALLLIALLCLAASAFGQKADVISDGAPGLAPDRTNCETTGYDAYGPGPSGFVPDDDPGGVLLGPIATSSTGTIQDVILTVWIEHTWIGDLRMFLYYDPTCTGAFEAQGDVLCRPGLTGCAADGCCGCSGNLLGEYQFDDTEASIEDGCASNLVPGCYGPDYDSSGLGIFDGRDSGGCFWLFVADGAGGDVGFIDYWYVDVLTGDTPVTEAPLDIKPTSCPNPLNVKSQGVLPAAILGTAAFDVADVDASSVLLEGVAPMMWNLGDVATPVGAGADPCECNEEGEDGFTDLTLKFRTQEIVAALGAVSDGDEVEITLTASLMDGTPFTASDCVWILDKGREPSRATPEDGGVEITAPRDSADDASWTTIKTLYR